MSSTQEQNEDVVRRFITETDRGNPEILLEVMTEDARWHLGGATLDRESLLAASKSFNAAFPDLKHGLEDLFAVGDRVVMRGVNSGTHTGEFMGLAPTDRSVKFGILIIFRLEEGRIAEAWEEADVLGLLAQLGVKVPPDAT
ncbi:MAG: ester cyclase [Gemmatimonadales bacterium]|jgi:predicted ester cyclase|nr:MAG: ester cyclase [Gemmatimonadales bacterium]